MNDSYKDLRYNTFIIAIANIGSKAISFLLAPLYSYFLTTGEYGMMDLFATTASLLGPLFCLDIYEATFRFAKDDTYKKADVLSSSLALCAGESLFCTLLLILYCVFNNPPVTIVLCLISVFIDTILNTLTQYVRGCDEIKVFAFSGVVNSFVLLSGNIVLMIFMRLGLTGWVISYVIAKVITIFYLCIRNNIIKVVSVKCVNKAFLKEALRYSLPLMPNAMIWWVMNASDRYVLTALFGTSIVGVYAVASKIPSILSIFENIFYQAWMTSTIDSLDDKNRGKFYSEVFNNYFKVLCIGIIGLLVILKPLIVFLFADEYHEAWMCAAVLLVGVLVHALAGNLGAFYGAFKVTTGALKTSIAGAITNFILNLIFIPKFGMMAAATTTLIGYIVVLLWRWMDVNKLIKLKFEFSHAWYYILMIVIQLVLYYTLGYWSYGMRVIILLYVIYKNRNLLLKMIKR